MFPLDPYLLMMLKVFVVFTCIFFWIKLMYDVLMRGHNMRRRHRHH